MSVIVPAVLPQTKRELDEKLDRLSEIDGVEYVQVDVIDGRFAAPANWPYAGGSAEFAAFSAAGETLPHLGKLKFEVDLMVSDPEQVTGAWLSLGASRITVHVESTSYLPRVITDLKHKYGHDKDFVPDLLSFGLAINLATELSILEPYLADIDYVQFMGIATIGKQAQPFDRRVLRKIEAFRKMHPGMTMQVDGGVSLQSAPELLSAGVDRLIVGSAIVKAPDMRAEFRKFERLAEQYGAYER